MKVLLFWWLLEVKEYQQQEGVPAHTDLSQASVTQKTSMDTPAPVSGGGMHVDGTRPKVTASTSPVLSVLVTDFHKKA